MSQPGEQIQQNPEPGRAESGGTMTNDTPSTSTSQISSDATTEQLPTTDNKESASPVTAAESCAICGGAIIPADQLSLEKGMFAHKSCFKCTSCAKPLLPDSSIRSDGVYYCIECGQQITSAENKSGEKEELKKDEETKEGTEVQTEERKEEAGTERQAEDKREVQKEEETGTIETEEAKCEVKEENQSEKSTENNKKEQVQTEEINVTLKEIDKEKKDEKKELIGDEEKETELGKETKKEEEGKEEISDVEAQKDKNKKKCDEEQEREIKDENQTSEKQEEMRKEESCEKKEEPNGAKNENSDESENVNQDKINKERKVEESLNNEVKEKVTENECEKSNSSDEKKENIDDEQKEMEKVDESKAASKQAVAKKGCNFKVKLDKCIICDKTAYAAERYDLGKGTFVHKNCFKCTKCIKLLLPGSYAQLDNKFYCRACNKKAIEEFSAAVSKTKESIQKNEEKGETIAASPVTSETIVEIKNPETKATLENKDDMAVTKNNVNENDVTLKEEEKEEKVETKISEERKNENVDAKEEQKESDISESTNIKSTEANEKEEAKNTKAEDTQKVAVEQKANSAQGDSLKASQQDRIRPKRKVTISTSNPKCPVCGKPVYFTERVEVKKDVFFHKNCFKCKICNKVLSQNKFIFYNGETLCNACHANELSKDNAKQAVEKQVAEGEEQKSTVSTAGKELCSACGKPVYLNERVLAADRFYHKNCFRCHGCNKILHLPNFKTYNKEPMCLTCHENLHHADITRPSEEISSDFDSGKGDPCTGCGKTVFSAERIDILGVWHPKCFKCFQCGRLLNKNTVTAYQKKPACSMCYQAAIHKESLVRTENARKVASRNQQRRATLTKAEIDKLEEDAAKTKTLLCKACHTTLYAAEMVATEHGNYHRECFRCFSCNAVLRAGQHRFINEMPYCKHCIEDAANPNVKLHAGTNSKRKPDEAAPEQPKSSEPAPRKFLKPKVTFSRRSASKRHRSCSNPFAEAAEKDEAAAVKPPTYDIWAAIDARAEKERAQKIAEREKAEAELAKRRSEKRAEEERMFLEMEERRRKATMLRIEEDDRKKKQDIFNSVSIHAADLGPGVKLIMVKGRYKIQVRVVPLSVASLRQDACFVLENQKQLFVFHGSKANRMEKAKAIDLANRIKYKDHAGGGEVLFVADRGAKFWSLLGGKESDIDESICEDSVEYESREEEKVLVQAVVAGADGKPVLQPLKPVGEKARPSHVLCETTKVVILSVGIEVYLWYGKKTTREMRAFGKDEAERLVRENSALPVETLREGAELSVFCDKFCDWPGMLLISVNNQGTGGEQKHHAREPYDVSALFRTIDARNEGEDTLTPEEAVRGTVSVWLVRDIAKVAVPQELYGCFFSRHSYVVQHVFVADNGMKKTSIFFWQGRDCSYAEKASSALLAQDIFKEVSKRGEAVTQERVPQGKETDSFVLIFKGKLTVLKGSPEGFKPQGTIVLRVLGEKYKYLHERVTKEEPYHCLTLNQGFVVFQSDPPRSVSFMDAETEGQDQAKALVEAFDKFVGVLLATELHTEPLVVEPHPEQTPSERMQAVLRSVPEWTFNALFTLPGEAQPVVRQGTDDADALSAAIPMYYRTLLVSCQGMNLGYVRGKPSQLDLDSKNFFFLRLGATVYVWIGARAPPTETRWVLAAALEFAKREGVEEVLCVNEMQEPKAFAAAFDDWEPLGSDALKQVPMSADTLLQTFFAFYSFEDLQANKIPGIDRTRLEDYLTEEDFEAHFGMKKEEWSKIPEWKRVEKKREMNFL